MNQIDTIYNRFGQPILRLFDNGRIIDFRGRSIGFLYNEHLYKYSGLHAGWYENGIMRDHRGFCVGFGEFVTDQIHPLLPLKYLKPLPNLPVLEPLRPLRYLPPLKPLRSFIWSNYEPLDLFLI